MSNTELINKFKIWETQNSSSHDGLYELVQEAKSGLLNTKPEDITIKVIDKLFKYSEEDEFMQDEFKENVKNSNFRYALELLSKSTYPETRWQIYDIAKLLKEEGLEILELGILDEDPYCKRRAIIAISNLNPPNLQQIADSVADSKDPYLRLAGLILANSSADFNYKKMYIENKLLDHENFLKVEAKKYLKLL